MPLTLEELDLLIDAVEYKAAVSEQCDPNYFRLYWKPLLEKLIAYRETLIE